MSQLLTPQPGKQTDFLSSTADIVIYGGGAGAGKTRGLLMEPLRHLNNKKFRALIFRRSLPQIKKPGALRRPTSGLHLYKQDTHAHPEQTCVRHL